MTSSILDSDTVRASLIRQALWLIDYNVVRPSVYEIGTIAEYL